MTGTGGTLTLADVLQGLGHARPAGAERIDIADVVVDSRKVTAGALFVAIKGQTRDGHDYIGEAVTRGAVAIISETRSPAGVAEYVDKSSRLGPSVRVVDTGKGVAGLQPSPEPLVPLLIVVPSSLKGLQDIAACWRERFDNCRAIGVTGSIGKSSTKELIASVLQRRFRVLRNQGNLNNEIGLPLTLLQMNASHERAVVEMGMYGLGEIRDLCRIAQPFMGVVTNVGPSHLERLGTIERIAAAKSELVEALPAGGVAILNRDDPRVRAMQAQSKARVFFYGLDPQSDLWADRLESHGLEGISFQMHDGADTFAVDVPLPGRHSVYTALAAASVGICEGLSWNEILAGVTDSSARLRLLAVPAENGTTILDDTYNASPDSTVAALNLLAELDGRPVAVLGDMLELGSLQEQGHRSVGKRAAEVAQVLIAVGSRGKWIGAAAVESGLTDGTYFAENNAEAIAILRKVTRPGDVILVKGSRGAQMEEIVAAFVPQGDKPN